MTTTTYPAIRSLFFAPGNRPDLVAKFPRFGADCCVIDLEDGTPPAEKAKARRLAAEKNELGLEGPAQVDVGTPGPVEAVAEVVDEQPARRKGAPKGPRGLMPVHHPNRDFFLCDLFDYALKDDGVSMEAPIFTLATKPDTSVWHWDSKDGARAITVTPSVA